MDYEILKRVTKIERNRKWTTERIGGGSFVFL